MVEHNPQLGLLSKEQRRQAIDDIIAYFGNELGETIGVVAAEQILEMFLESTGNRIYNKGVQDSKKLLRSRLEDFDIDLEALILE